MFSFEDDNKFCPRE